MQKTAPCQAMIALLEKQSSVDFTVSHPLNREVRIPLIYLLCQHSDYHPVVKYMMKRRCNVNLNTEPFEPLLLATHSLYLQHLLKRKATFPVKNRQKWLVHKLVGGGWKRISLLLNHGIVSSEEISSAVAMKDVDVLYQTLVRDKKRLMVSLMQSLHTTTPRAQVEDMVHQWLALYRFLFAHGYVPSVQCIEFCVEMYIFELLQLDAFVVPEGVKPVYHEHKSKALEVSLLRPLLNDYRYEQTCKVLQLEPHPEVYAKFRI